MLVLRVRRNVWLGAASTTLLLLLVTHRRDGRNSLAPVGERGQKIATRGGVVNFLTQQADMVPVKPLGCVRTEPVLGVAPVICIKPEEEDKYISSSLLYEGMWEGPIVTSVLKAVNEYKDAVFLDLGSNIGMYSVMVAALRWGNGNHKPGNVVAVDARADNLAFIRRSLINSKIPSKAVTLVHNAVSDAMETLYPVPMADEDPGTNPGSIAFVREEELAGRKVLGPPTASVTLAAILETLPIGPVIVKMDIQGQECATLLATGAFNTGHTLPYIFMEWVALVMFPENCPDLSGFIGAMEARGYSPRWPESFAVMPRHCLDGPTENVVWVHRSARPVWEQEIVLDCLFDPSLLTEMGVVPGTEKMRRAVMANPQFTTCPGCQALSNSRLKRGWELVEEPGRVQLATILTSGGGPPDPRYSGQLGSMLAGLLEQSAGAALTLIVITDSIMPIKIIKNAIGKYLSEKVLKDKFGEELFETDTQMDVIDIDAINEFMASKEFQEQKRINHPNIKVELLDINSIIKPNNKTIQEMKKYFGPNNKTISIGAEDPRREYYFPSEPSGNAVEMVFPPRYDRDLFYIAPFYHTELPAIDRLIVIDLDIEFRCNISELWRQFDQFGPEEVVSVASNQSPYYHLATTAYRQKHPATAIGSPGKLQGLNTGVVLYHLARMRGSAIYREAAGLKGMVALHHAFLPSADWGLGDQEWLTLLSWQQPALLRLLPCQYNRQASRKGGRGGVWEEYFSCPQGTRVFHTTPLW